MYSVLVWEVGWYIEQLLYVVQGSVMDVSGRAVMLLLVNRERQREKFIRIKQATRWVYALSH